MTRGVRVLIRGTSNAYIQVSANKIDSAPWEPPTVTLPQSKIRYDQWRDLCTSVEQGFVEYAKRYSDNDEKLILIEEKV
jgi:hypothetical protein